MTIFGIRSDVAGVGECGMWVSKYHSLALLEDGRYSDEKFRPGYENKLFEIHQRVVSKMEQLLMKLFFCIFE